VAFLTDPNNVDALTDILLYHVVGEDVILSTDLSVGLTAVAANSAILVVTSLEPPTINEDSVVVTADIKARNGVIHLIDTVLQPPPDIVEIAVDNPDFSTLVDLVGLAGLVETLSGDGPFTVFA
jgi:transforming growth factor-beta-induced protein